jgi:spermidine/putrescine transport system ATP-binding protein
VRLAEGTEIAVAANGRTGDCAAGVRPEKIRLGEQGGANRLSGRIKETAYVGVATQLIVETGAGTVSVYLQNAEAGTAPPTPGAPVTLTWSPEATFVVDREEEPTP